MFERRGILICLLWLGVSVGVRGADPGQKLRKNGAEVYYADLDLRPAFAKTVRGVLPEARRKRLTASAPALDWVQFVPSYYVLNQADSATCWAFAALTAFEYNWAIRNGGRMPFLAVQPILDRTGKYGSGNAGWALKDLLDHGTCLASAYPHVGKPGKLRSKVPMRYRAIAWGKVAGAGGVPAVEQIKQALVDHGPLVVYVYTTPAFKAYKGGAFHDDTPIPKESPTNHLLLIVGWDDSKGKNGCWKIQNSWAEKWGERGFMWIEYGSNNIGHSACWVRSQSIRYPLPDDIHKRVSADTVPFPTWRGARKVTAKPPDLPEITPTEALERKGERVQVRMRVNGGEIHPREGHVQLFSEKSWRNEHNLNVRILKSELGKFAAENDRALLASYLGKEIRVRGSVQSNPIRIGGKPANKPFLEVGDPDQIEVLK